jgi:hypothetical protein
MIIDAEVDVGGGRMSAARTGATQNDGSHTANLAYPLDYVVDEGLYIHA